MFLPFHPNGLKFTYELMGGEKYELTYFSIGGGFVVKENESLPAHDKQLPFPIQNGNDLGQHCEREGKSIAKIVWENEKVWRTPAEIYLELDQLWETMQACVYKGCCTEGELPGGLNVKRRAADLNRKLLENVKPATRSEWLQAILDQQPSFHRTLKWVSCFAIATNEENAAFGRIVTAPTNGAAGVIPAVLFYYVCFCENVTQEKIRNFLLVAGEIGSVFKKGATISAAMGGCQAEIGVSSAMAAAALTECLDGNPGQVLMAAEIAEETHRHRPNQRRCRRDPRGPFLLRLLLRKRDSRENTKFSTCRGRNRQCVQKGCHHFSGDGRVPGRDRRLLGNGCGRVN